MNLRRFILLIAGVFVYMSSSAQLTTQKKIVSRLNINNGGSRTIDLKDNGSLLVLNFVRDSLSYSSLADFEFMRGTYLVRLDNNSDTLWTRIIYNLHTLDCILNKDNKIILVAKKFALNGSQLQCGLDLLKLDLNGVQIKSAYFNNENSLCSFNNSSYYYETDVFSACINEYRDNTYIIFYNGFYKFNDNLDLIDKKLYPDMLSFGSFQNGNSLFNLNDSTLATAVYSPAAFPGNGSLGNNEIVVIDTQMNVKKLFKVDNPFTYFLSVTRFNNSILLNGKTVNSPTGSINGLNFFGLIDPNNFSGTGKKRILRYRPEYTVLSGVASSSVCKVKNDKLYSLIDLGVYSTVNDSTGFNNRRYLYCFDTALNINWSKRLHLFNTFDTVPTNTENSLTLLAADKKTDFIFKSDKIIVSGYDYQSAYYAGSFFNRKNFGFNLSAIDTNGNNALCNATTFNSYLMEDSLGFLNLPIPSPGTTVFPQFITNTVSIENFPPQQIVQKCLPVKPPKSKFIFGNIIPGEAVCINTLIAVYEYSYNEPGTWEWILPPEADVSGVNPLYVPFLQYIRFTQAGVFPIKLVTTNDAGTDTLTQFITVINFIPQPHLGNDTTICNGDSVRIIYTDPPNSEHYFTGPGIYTTSDTLVIRDSGQYIIAAYTVCGYLYDTINVHVIFKPDANFGFTATCSNLTVAFTDSTKLNGNLGVSYQYAWKQAQAPPSAYTNFSTLPNNNFSFASYDSFDVRLIVTSTGNCIRKDTIVKRIVLGATPVAGCSVLTNCGSLQASFTSSATVSPGSLAQQEYYVGNTLIGTGASFVYSFPAFGSYTVKQVVKSNVNCISDTFFLPVIIKDKPQVTLITARDSVCNSSYTITANASVNASTISNYVWLKNNVVLPNNTSTLTETNPPGIYTYKLVATSALNCSSDTATKTITVVSKPATTLHAVTNCGSKSIAITASSSVINDVISVHYISYGDGNAAAINPNNTNYTYSSFGTYTVKYVVQSSIGCASDTVYQTIDVKDKFVTTIGYSNNACQNTNYTLTANTSVAAGSISNYTWLKNNVLLPFNSNTITENNPAGTYTYKLAASSTPGCTSDTAILTVVVQNYPTAIFTATGGCVGKAIAITNNSTNNNTVGNLQYAWVTSDGQTSAALTPAFSFATNGTKTIQLTTTTENGCTNSITKTVVIDAYPIAAFDIVEACIGRNMVINNNSTGAITSYTWQTSDAQQSSSTVPQFIFNAAGNYSIKLDVATANNCSTSLTKNTIIQPVQLITTPGIDTNVNVNQPLQLNITGAQTYSWTPFTNLNNAGISNPVFKTNTPGTYPLTVQATTAQGCKGSATMIIKVFATGDYVFMPNAFTPNGDALNDKFIVTCSGLKSLSFFRVYNRYGQTVYQQNTCNNNGWDGNFKGKAQPGGTYVYNWQGVAFNGQTVSGTGTVILIR